MKRLSLQGKGGVRHDSSTLLLHIPHNFCEHASTRICSSFYPLSALFYSLLMPLPSYFVLCFFPTRNICSNIIIYPPTINQNPHRSYTPPQIYIIIYYDPSPPSNKTYTDTPSLCYTMASSSSSAPRSRTKSSTSISSNIPPIPPPATSERLHFIKDIFHRHKEQWEHRFSSSLGLGVNRKVAILTCMDSRLHIERMLGLELGDAEVIRNAGGRVTMDVLRSLWCARICWIVTLSWSFITQTVEARR